MIKLKVEKRDSSEKLDLLRSSGMMPAVFYGPKEPSTAIKFSLADFKKVWREAGESTVVLLEGPGIEVEVLIQTVDLDPVTDISIHVDFYVIEKGKKLSVDVPLEFVGVSPAVKDLGAVLIKVVHDLEIEALPKDLPHNLTVDISGLVTFDSVLTAGDIKLPEGVTLNAKADEVIASVFEPKEEIIEEVPVDLADIEVEKKGKEAKEGDEGAEGEGRDGGAEATEAGGKKDEKKDRK